MSRKRPTSKRPEEREPQRRLEIMSIPSGVVVHVDEEGKVKVETDVIHVGEYGAWTGVINAAKREAGARNKRSQEEPDETES